MSNALSPARRATPASRVQTSYFPLGGGVNETDPSLTITPGECLYALNHEQALPRGYGRVDGYERYDGQPAPSEAQYWGFRVHTVTQTLIDALPADIVDSFSGQTARALTFEPKASATDGTLTFVHDQGGPGFTESANIELASNPGVGEAVINDEDATPVSSIASDDDDYYRIIGVAREDARALITEVPGEGPVRGVWMFKGIVYAFRDKEGGLTAGMYKETTSGWDEIVLGQYQLPFLNGVSAIFVGDTVEVSGGTGTAVVLAVVHETGAWGAATPSDQASGFLLLDAEITHTVPPDSTDDWTSAPLIQVIAPSPIPVADAAAAPYSARLQEIAPGGHYEFVNYNFYATAEYLRMYGINGVGPAFEFDGTALVFIETGLSDELNKPTHIAAYHMYLWLAFRGGSVQHSSLGLPIIFNPLWDAVEIGVGDDVTGFDIGPDDTLIIFSRNRIHIVYGEPPSSEMHISPYHNHVGAVEWSVQKIGQSWYMDDRGLTTLSSTQQHGDFRQNSVSTKVEDLILTRIKDIRSSVISRRKNQYRLFWGDKLSVWATFKGNMVLGFMPIQYDMQVFCTESIEELDGNERLFAGAEDGFVYELDKGTSFDGAKVKAVFVLHYHHYGSPSNVKRFRGITFEMDTRATVPVRFQPDFGYGSSEIPKALSETSLLPGQGGLWDFSKWDLFLWSGQIITDGRHRLDGVGRNMSILIFSEEGLRPPYNIQGVTVAYSKRKLLR